MIERNEFYQRYKMTPQHFVKRYREEGAFIKKLHALDLIGLERDETGAEAYLIFTDNGVEEICDLRPHWERGSDAPIHCCREGAMNLVKAVYAQTEKDLEELYAGGEIALNVNKEVGESYEQYIRRSGELYRKELKKCETFLGPVFSRYTMIKAYYVRRKMTVEEIAKVMHETPAHISNVIERLGLNRTETVAKSAVDYIDE